LPPPPSGPVWGSSGPAAPPPFPSGGSTTATPTPAPASVIAPAYATDQAAAAERGLASRRGLLLVVAGGVAAIALAIVAVTTMSGSSEPKPAAQTAPPNRAAVPPPSPSPAKPRSNVAPSIDSERTDRGPLRLTDVFPGRPLPLGGRVYKQDKTSVNHECGLVARGAMAEALVRGHCRSVVRATYVDTKKRFAVTAGVVAMPTRARAVAARRAGDPSQYEWFRGMPGKVAQNIDRAGGYAASTIRGRYIIYSYTTYLGGHTTVDDRLLATVGRQFVAYAVHPIERRSH
jgi:hypothetical protein